MIRDAKKLDMSPRAVAKLEAAMERLESGTAKPGEIGKVRGSIYELRVNQDDRWYRLLFAKEGAEYVALLLGAKKTNQLNDKWTATAEKRLLLHIS